MQQFVLFMATWLLCKGGLYTCAMKETLLQLILLLTQDKIRSLLEKTHQEKLDLNTNIQNRKDYRNPRWVSSDIASFVRVMKQVCESYSGFSLSFDFSIYKKLLQFLNIDETGSNYPKVGILSYRSELIICRHTPV